MKYDYLIVGSGLFGAVFAYKAHKLNRRCLVIEKRSHLGGNIYCEQKQGINIHKYGAHIFHTSNPQVWDFVNSLVPFNRYTNSPIAVHQGKVYNLPFNMNTFSQMWGTIAPQEAANKLAEQRAAIMEEMQAQGIVFPRNLEEQALCLVGRDIYEAFIKGYTEKQWGRPCSELPPFIIKRLPVRMVYDNNYFNDSFQGIPIGGYNRLTEKLLDGIECLTDEDFFEKREYWKSVAKKIVYTGKLDEFYDYCYGRLQYRTVSFEEETIKCSNYQGCAVVNYTAKEIPFTRIIEHKHFESFGADIESNPYTVISKEYSAECVEDSEPFYPINDEVNSALADRYRALANQEENVIFGGRLAEYKYYDMAPVIENVLNHAEFNS